MADEEPVWFSRIKVVFLRLKITLLSAWNEVLKCSCFVIFHFIGVSLTNNSFFTGDFLKSNCDAFVIGRGMLKWKTLINKLNAYLSVWWIINLVFALQYQIAQMYMVMKMQQQSTTGDEGVEVLQNKPFSDDEFGEGQYTSKVYHLQR